MYLIQTSITRIILYYIYVHLSRRSKYIYMYISFYTIQFGSGSHCQGLRIKDTDEYLYKKIQIKKRKLLFSTIVLRLQISLNFTYPGLSIKNKKLISCVYSTRFYEHNRQTEKLYAFDRNGKLYTIYIELYKPFRESQFLDK